MDADGTEKILDLLREYFEPEAADSAYREVVRFSQLKRTGQTTDGFLVEFDFLCRKAESRMQGAGASPEAIASALRMQTATLSRSEKSLALAGAQGNLGNAEAARQMVRLFGPRRGVARQDVLAATTVAANSNDDGFAAWIAYRKAKTGKAKRDGAAGTKKVAKA